MTQQDSDFAAFMKVVDATLQKNTEGTLTAEQLSDHDFWIDFHNKRAPDEVAYEVLVNEGFVFVDD